MHHSMLFALAPALLLLGSCGTGTTPAEAGAVQAATSASEPRAFELTLDPARALKGYAWDGGAEVPWLGEHPPARIPFGEFGRTPKTLLYFTFERGLEAELATQAGWSVAAHGLAAGAGRFGAGCSFGAGAGARFTLPAAARTAGAWTVELWLRPSELRQRAPLALRRLLTL